MGRLGFTRRDFLKAAAASALAAGLPRWCLGSKGPQDKPNIVFIMSDDHAAHALSCYGSSINKTPNLDRLAKEGMRFTNCFCTNSICAPSRATILTGKYSHLNGVIDNAKAFDGTQQTFPKLLQKAGYETAIVGKWHLKSDPVGFDYWNILPGQGAYHDPVMIKMGQGKEYSGYTTDIITDHCIDWLKARDAGKPFCLLCHHKAPHRNWSPDPKYAKLYEDIQIPEPETFNDDYATRCEAARHQAMTVEKHLTPHDLKAEPPEGLEGQALKGWKYQRYIKDYLRCVASIDDSVGRLLDYLDSEGLTEKTIVVYTSDQGFFLGDHGWYDKRFMYEEALRMPLLVRCAPEIKAGSVSDHIVLNLDFAPTLLDFAGLTPPADMQGRSLRRILGGRTPRNWRQSMYYNYYENGDVGHRAMPHYGVRTRRHKLIHFHAIDAWELYDLVEDPHELNNLYGNPAYADIGRELRAELERLQRLYGDSPELTTRLIEERKRKL